MILLFINFKAFGDIIAWHQVDNRSSLTHSLIRLSSSIAHNILLFEQKAVHNIGLGHAANFKQEVMKLSQGAFHQEASL